MMKVVGQCGHHRGHCSRCPIVWHARRYVFHQAPLGFNAQNALRYFTGQCEQTQQVFFDGSRAGAWVLVPRDGGPIVRVPTEPQMIWHYANAFEDESTGEGQSRLMVELLSEHLSS